MTLTGTVPFSIRPRRRWGAFARFIRRPRAALAVAIALAIVLLVVFADVVAPINPASTDLSDALAPPSAEHLLGTDGSGRDIWSRLLHGGQLTLLGALLVLAVALVIGGGAGLLSGYFGRWVEASTLWVTSLLMALPVMVILLAVRAAVGAEILIIMLVLGVLVAPNFYLLVRSSVKGVRNELYVDAARVSGLSDARIIGTHILAAVRAPLIIQAVMVAGMAIGIQAALDFLGIGVATVPSWGGMLSDAFAQVYNAPQLMLWPALAIGLMTASLLVIGNELRDTVEDRPRPRPITNAVRVADRDGGVAPPSGVLLRVHDVCVAYGTDQRAETEVVHHVSFDIGRGKVLGLVGESGSGKTQIAFTILGLLPDAANVTAGGVWLESRNLLALSPVERLRSRVGGVAYIPQEPMGNLDPCFTIGDQLMEPLRVARGMSKSAARETAMRLLADVSIPDPAKTMRSYPHEISGGMAQRVLIAAALSLDPVLLVADEPTTALDVTVQADVLALLRRLQRDRDLTVLIVTHDLGVAAELCDDIVVLKDGAIVEQGDAERIFYRPATDYTRSLLAATMADAQARPAWGTREGSAA